MGEQRRKPDMPAGSWGAGIAIGLGVGIALGVALGNIGIGIAIGAGLAVAFAIAFGEAAKDKNEGTRKGDDDGAAPSVPPPA